MTDKKVSDWEDVSKSSSEWEDVPNLAKKEPSLGEHLYGGAYGLGTSVLGGIGDIESMVTAPAVDPKLRGQETVFPTTENVRTGLSKIGVPKPASGTEPSVTLGEFVPAIAGHETWAMARCPTLFPFLLGLYFWHCRSHCLWS